MTGSHEIVVKNRRLRYRFIVYRNITILRGDSATGKTTLIDMIDEYQTNGARSGIDIRCDKSCVVLNQNRWESVIRETTDSIVFIDEGCEFVISEQFARLAKNSDNYFVIATRGSLPNLPYSIMEVYGIRNVSGNRYQGTKRLYTETYHLYKDRFETDHIPDVVIVEDSGSGYQFFSEYFARYDIECISAGGNTGVYDTIINCSSKNMLVIVDGAAFGPHMERTLSLSRNRNIFMYLPESFEWLILSSGVIKGGHIREILKGPSDYIESEKFFSWERFFTDMLKKETRGTYLEYNKRRLNDSYRQKEIMNKIMTNTPVKINRNP